MAQQVQSLENTRKHWGPTPAWERAGRIIFGGIFRPLFRYSSSGAEHFPKTGPVLLLANHNSFIDPVLLGLGCPRPIAFLAKAEAFDNKIMANLITKWGAHPLHRERADTSAVRIALKVIRDGQVLGIFPEGTRSHNGKLQELKQGTTKLALKLRAPIVPAGIEGTYEAFPRTGKFPRFFTRIHINLGKPFELDWDQPSAPENVQRATDLIRERMAELLPVRYK